MDEIFTPPFEEEPQEPMGLVGRIEKLVAQLDPGHPVRAELLGLSAELQEREDIMDEARETIEKLEAVIKSYWNKFPDGRALRWQAPRA